MADSSEIKKLERRARALLLNKEIPSGKMDVVRSLMNNDDLMPEEKYRTVIDLLRVCPDKEPVKPKPKPAGSGGRRRVKKETAENVSDAAGIQNASEAPSTPTETSYYIDHLKGKYNHLKLFKKRYLVHRDNRLGIGFRKRLIPTRKFIRCLRELSEYQETVTSRLSPVLMDILNDESITNPVEFNYLRLVRSWLMDTPMSRQNFEGIKWMERPHFEREFRQYICNFMAFQKLDTETREAMILMVENKLRESEELKKEDINQRDSDQLRREKEKRNLAREKSIYDYMLLLRAFLPGELNSETPLSKHLKGHYQVNNLSKLLMIIAEVLVFQRPLRYEEIIHHYQIQRPEVSRDRWNYSDELLRKVGKDPESQRQRELERVKQDLQPYETMYKMIKSEDRGRNLPFRGASLQWKLVDKNRNDPSELYEENFMAFLDSATHFFRNTFLPLLDGRLIKFRAPSRDEFEGEVFSSSLLYDELMALEGLLNDLHLFHSNNPTLMLSHSEVQRIMKGQLSSMDHVRELTIAMGNFFYGIAVKLLKCYNAHRVWIFHGSARGEGNTIRSSYAQLPSGTEEAGRPVPFYDCVIMGAEEGTPLFEQLRGKRVVGDSPSEGIFSYMVSYAWQMADLCNNAFLQSDMQERQKLLRRLKDLDRGH
jgi:hypothetical protein